MQIYLTCNYCGHKWDQYAYGKSMIEALKCPVCKDTGLTVRSEKEKVVDTYEGSPPFEPKRKQ